MQPSAVHKVIESAAAQSVQTMAFLSSAEALAFMAKASECLAKAFSSGNKALVAGNGGSLCDAAHFAEELTGNFRKPRRALPAIVLSEPGHVTCVGNDFGFDDVFRRGVEAFGQPGDVFIALSTSGRSPNIINAVREAKARSLRTICLLGKGGGIFWEPGRSSSSFPMPKPPIGFRRSTWPACTSSSKALSRSCSSSRRLSPWKSLNFCKKLAIPPLPLGS